MLFHLSHLSHRIANCKSQLIFYRIICSYANLAVVKLLVTLQKFLSYCMGLSLVKSTFSSRLWRSINPFVHNCIHGTVDSPLNYVIILITSATLSPPSFIPNARKSLPPFIQSSQELILKTFWSHGAMDIVVSIKDDN